MCFPMCESRYRCCQIRFLKHCWVSPMYNESHSHSNRYTTLLVAKGSIEGLIWKLIRFFMLIVLWTMRRLKLGINLFISFFIFVIIGDIRNDVNGIFRIWEFLCVFCFCFRIWLLRKSLFSKFRDTISLIFVSTSDAG